MQIGPENFEMFKAMSDLERLATNFVKRSYLEIINKLPRFQDIPKEAFIVKCESPIFISHAWQNAYQPKDSLLNQVKSFIPNHEGIGVWIDYCCVPQKQNLKTETRTSQELEFFKAQLQYIPTILLKSQLLILWNEKDLNRAWCVIEYILADIFKNLIMKQIYHSKDKLTDIIVLGQQTYNPVGYEFVGGVEGKPVIKILTPHHVKNVPSDFYNFLLNQMELKPMPLTILLKKVERIHIDSFFENNLLTCSNKKDVEVLKRTLLKVCEFAGNYDVSSIKWHGKISYGYIIPFIMANLSDFTVSMVDYRF